MSEQLSIVQQLWRDRREEFEAYLNGEMTCHDAGGLQSMYPGFSNDPETYFFRPLPKPPKLRPLTREEWIERMRDDWFVRAQGSDYACRIGNIAGSSVNVVGCGNLCFDVLFQAYEMSPDCIHWQPCGIETEREPPAGSVDGA